MVEQLTAHLSDLILLALTGVIGVGIAYLKKQVENSQFKESLTATLETIDAVARSSLQNVGSLTKAALKDGKITPEEATEIKAAARLEFDNVISPKMTERLNVHMNDADKFVTAKINAVVEGALKEEKV